MKNAGNKMLAVTASGALLVSSALFTTAPLTAQGQTAPQFISANATPEGAIQFHWASNPDEFYAIDYASQLGGNDDGSTQWETLCEEYPSHGTNTFWLDTGNYYLSLPHPKKAAARFYRIRVLGTDDGVKPSVAITSPADGGVVSGNLTVTVAASSANVLTDVKLYVDGEKMPISADGRTFTINTCEWWNGRHVLFATAKSVSHLEGIPGDTSVTYGHAVSAYVHLTFSNLISEIAFSEPYFKPSLGQTQIVTAQFSANCDWTLTIVDVNRQPVRTAAGRGNAMKFAWDGNGDGGVSIPDGVYHFLINAQTTGLPAQTLSAPVSTMTAMTAPSLDTAPQLYAADEKAGVFPLAIYPPGLDTNGLTLFSATPAELNSLKMTAQPAIRSASLLSANGTASPQGISPTSANQAAEASKRTTEANGKGALGTFFMGYQSFFDPLYRLIFIPPIRTGWPSYITPQYIQVDGQTSQLEAGRGQYWGALLENVGMAQNFAETMTAARWEGTVKDNLQPEDVRGGIFNNCNVGFLATHGSYGSTAEIDGIKHSYLRFYDRRTRTPSYCRLDDCKFGGPGTNGLKWMAMLVCNTLQDGVYNDMYNYNRLPINDDLHLLLGAKTVTLTLPEFGTYFAGYLTGTVVTNKMQTVPDAWFLTGKNAYDGDTNHAVIIFRVAGWPDAFNDKLTDVDKSWGTGNPLDIKQKEITVFSKP